MKHYHGTPLGGTRQSVARFIAAGRRHFLVPFGRAEDLPIVAEASVGFCLDNGAFTAWRKGTPITDWRPYYQFVAEWARCPRFDFAIIPDVIDGTEAQNDDLIDEWTSVWPRISAAPVWHLHESLARLQQLAIDWPRICLGSSGDFSQVGTQPWHSRMAQAMDTITDEQGRPITKIHGLRMLAPDVVSRYPLASADSTNVAQNSQLLQRFGIYPPPTQEQRREVIASRIETTISPSVWVACAQQEFSLL